MESKSVPDYWGVNPNPESGPEKGVDVAMEYVRFIGAAFTSGTSVGALYYFLKGSLLLRGRDLGLGRFQSGFAMARSHGPRLGGRVAVFCLASAAIGEPLFYILRKKEKLEHSLLGKFYPYSPTISFINCSLTAAAFSAPRGPRASIRAALLFGSLCAFPNFLRANLELLFDRAGLRIHQLNQAQ